MYRVIVGKTDMRLVGKKLCTMLVAVVWRAYPKLRMEGSLVCWLNLAWAASMVDFCLLLVSDLARVVRSSSAQVICAH